MSTFPFPPNPNPIPLRFVSGTTGSLDGNDCLILRGRFTAKHIERRPSPLLLHLFVSLFVRGIPVCANFVGENHAEFLTFFFPYTRPGDHTISYFFDFMISQKFMVFSGLHEISEKSTIFEKHETIFPKNCFLLFNFFFFSLQISQPGFRSGVREAVLPRFLELRSKWR